MTLEFGDLVVMSDLKTTGLSVYYQEPLEIGCAIMYVVEGAMGELQFRQVGTTVAHLTLTEVAVSPEALATHGITSKKLSEGGVPLETALETLGKHVAAAKGEKEQRVFFVGANSDSFDMRMTQYTLAPRQDNVIKGGTTA